MKGFYTPFSSVFAKGGQGLSVLGADHGSEGRRVLSGS
ncbi:hypothetical protein AtDm6_0277 [Acetobacter tropicalis]|uniref:Uncharacterized protein n=1 Tax=Acetobacter tropicalis TaxID=104102 RepID=A0A094YWE1_9PROT|nr:hypothetical protein AtDm6_0277 [Acetobacter tropicalis]